MKIIFAFPLPFHLPFVKRHSGPQKIDDGSVADHERDRGKDELDFHERNWSIMALDRNAWRSEGDAFAQQWVIYLF